MRWAAPSYMKKQENIFLAKAKNELYNYESVFLKTSFLGGLLI